ncbi:Trimethyllysine dioxygenase [Venustampulla echinocandica]|uniref:Trimethyllysine dioxygenase n=1 Tax=Venustampulla echinocandica TaxID=2656787 RepID=A0A370TV03_9HELO|nr:Trimethyllysine dioxygenase [Venustampulla echinocandica]RDL39362.1 Trimethyllysine dioxygenase [Venustampulla echinocandica]
MNIQIQRLWRCRSRTPLFNAIKRSVVTEASGADIAEPSNSGNNAPSPLPTANGSGPDSQPRFKNNWKKTRSPYTTRILKPGTENNAPHPESEAPIGDEALGSWPPNIDPFLSGIYKVNGTIPRHMPRNNEKDSMGVWDNHQIPLKLRTVDGHYSTIFLPHMWLRDNCRCNKCVNQDTMQRAFDTFAIPEKVRPNKVVTEARGLRVEWSHDKHSSLYPWDWILKYIPKSATVCDENEKPISMSEDPRIYWGAEIKSNPPSVHYDEIMAGDAGVGTWTDKIRRYGFCYVDGCPVSPEKTQQLLERIAFIRVTHYGGFYDFTADLTMKDTAYTTLALPAHTDTTYFTDPAGLQMFHLLSHEEGSGGESLLVDGFHAARTLEKEDPDSYKVLSRRPITWHASGNEGITITPAMKFPVFNIEAPSRWDDSKKSHLIQVRWNNDDRGPIHPILSPKWYAAARKWNDILNRKDIEYWAQLEPGRPLIFDNWRVLHGRSAFTGKRRICGGYVNHDDYISRWRNTNFSREEALSQIL